MKKNKHTITKCLGLLKSVFFTGLAFLLILTGINWLNCISLNYQECKLRLQIANVNSKEPVFFPLVLKQINAVVVVTISIIHMPSCVSLMLLKNGMLKYLI